jgi:quercetin dioxygenase-like cupin family protein
VHGGFRSGERPQVGGRAQSAWGEACCGAGRSEQRCQHFFIKLPAGFSAALHHHTSDHYGMVVSGNMVFNVDGQDQNLPAGSYFSFTGQKKHTTHCAEGADCLLFVDSRGKWEVVEEKPAKQ